MDEKKRVLIVSSVPITHFGNLGLDRVTALEELGYEVDYLTKYQDSDPHVIGVLPPLCISPIRSYIKKYIPKRIINIFRTFFPCFFSKDYFVRGQGIVITSPNEDLPVVDNKTLLSLVKPIYNFVLVLAWQDMITSNSIKTIYDKLKVPIIIGMVDFQPITGGCYYFGSCRNFEKGCGNCPVLGGEDINDFTKRNFLIKQTNYNAINCGFRANPYSLEFVKKSQMISEERLDVSYYSMNEELYKPLNKHKCLQTFGIDKGKYVILSRFTWLGHERKGYQYLLAVINSFAEKIGDKKKDILLLLAGGKDESFERMFNVEVLNVGTLSIDKLIQAYSAADIFLSSSIDDAGPSMVNQSIMCGTPVLSFNIGSALYMVENGNTGYRVPLKDIEGMTNSLVEHFTLDDEGRQTMKVKCRMKGLETGSRRKSAQTLVDFAEKLSRL